MSIRVIAFNPLNKGKYIKYGNQMTINYLFLLLIKNRNEQKAKDVASATCLGRRIVGTPPVGHRDPVGIQDPAQGRDLHVAVDEEPLDDRVVDFGGQRDRMDSLFQLAKDRYQSG